MNFLKSVFSESDGSGSTSRILIALIVCFILGVGTAFGVITCKKKITPEQFDNFLGSAGTFIVTTTAPLYAINKGCDVLNNRNSNNSNTSNS